MARVISWGFRVRVTLRAKEGRWKGKGSPYPITERRVPELIPVLGSQPAGYVSHKPGGRLPLLSARPAVTPATLERAATSFAACLVNGGTMGVNSLPKTVTRQRRGCDSNPGRSAPESSTLTSRLPNHPQIRVKTWNDRITGVRVSECVWHRGPLRVCLSVDNNYSVSGMQL